MSVSAYDHFGTTVFLQLEKINFPNSQPKKLYNKANWDTFKKAADMHIDNSNLNEYSTKDLNALNDKNKQFVDMIIEAEKQAVPVKTSKNRPVRNKKIKQTAKTREITKRINMLTRMMRKESEDSEKLRIKALLRDTQKNSKEIYNNELNIEISNWCDSLNSTTSLSDMWNKLNSLKGVSRPSLHPDAAHKAECLIDNFTNRSSTDNLPEDIKNELKTQYNSRMEYIIKALNENDPVLFI